MSMLDVTPNSSYGTVGAKQLYRRAEATGRITLPAVPSMINEYVQMCDNIFKAIGISFNHAELEGLRSALSTELDIAFNASHRSKIIISYDSPQGSILNYHIQAQWVSIEAKYENWLATREPPLFGAQPDARVLSLAMSDKNLETFSILDLGAGTGRNALPLARLGHSVDVVEVTTKFAEIIQAAVDQESLNIRIFNCDIFDDIHELRSDYQLIILAEVATDFRSIEQLRKVFTLVSKSLATGGSFVLNTFVAKSGYTPDAAAREFGQQCYSAIFTPLELTAVVQGLKLELESDESAYEYEKANLPPGSWPQTSWFEAWAKGQDVFGIEKKDSPIELRWLVYRKVT